MGPRACKRSGSSGSQALRHPDTRGKRIENTMEDCELDLAGLMEKRGARLVPQGSPELDCGELQVWALAWWQPAWLGA